MEISPSRNLQREETIKGGNPAMSRIMKKTSLTRGLPPGTLTYVGDRKVEKVGITLIDYDERNFQEREVNTVEELFPFRGTPTVTWININGLHEVGIIGKIGAGFALHPLILEDILNTAQRPKTEGFDTYLFIVLKMLYLSEKTKELISEQVSIILGTNFVISFQEREGDVFEPIRDRIRHGKGRIRKMAADYLAYALLDAIVDSYFSILEHFGESIEGMEDELVNNPTPAVLQTIHKFKREMIFLRKSIWPLREVINGIEKDESSLICRSTDIYLRDVYDHTIQVIDTAESMREMISGMLDIYLSSLSNRMNEVMKVLTIFAAIFIPLTFLAGIYGMNFQYMPELGWRWSYFIVLAVMVSVVAGMLLYFKKKKWL
jgi:magnesium transporter